MSLLIKKQPFRVNNQKLNVSISQSKLKTSKNKSLIDMTGLSIFQLSQEQIHFLNTQLNQIYQVTMQVKNVGQSKQQIRLKKPKSQYLTVKLSKQGMIAPGLDVKITVTFQSKENQRIQDKFVIISQNYQFQVPIHVIPQAGKLSFQPFVNFGFIKIGNTKQMKWKIQNKSQAASFINLTPSIKGNCSLKIEPKNFTLQSKSSQEVLLTITSTQAGHIQGIIDIQPKVFASSNLDFVANFCQFSRMICDDQGNQLTQIDVQSMLAGQKIQISTNLVNNTPKSCQFRVSKNKGCVDQEHNNLITPQQFGRDDSQKLISFNPSVGIIQAYESIPFMTKIQAKFQETDQQLFCNYILGRVHTLPAQRQYSYTVKVHINQQESPLALILKGHSIIPKLQFNATFFNFGDIPMNTRSQKLLKIDNYSNKAIKINFNNSSNYTFSTKNIRINPNSSQSVTITFCPKIVSQLNEILPIIVGQFSFPFKVLGKGVFNTNINTRFLKRKLSQPKFQLPALIVKGQQMKVQDMDNTLIQNQVSYINGENKKKQKQNSMFFEEVNQSKVHFDASYKSIHNESINGNSIYITEQKRTKILRDRKGKQVKIDSNNLDPNTQIQPYPSNARNQQQQRIVNKQLTSLQLTNIQVGPVCINIGKIYLRSIIKKTFHILNFNQKPISIQLNTNNLQCYSQSSQQKQIIPNQSWGGLNIRFQALKQGQFKHNLQYIINGKHFFQMMIQGNVIQPTLNLSKQQIKFFASEEDKGFEKKQTFVLTNPYQYQVGFKLKLQDNSLFKVQPQSGTVSSNGQKTITIYHRFDSLTQFGVKIQQIIKLKINHGKTIEFKCISFVPECNCVSKSQQINFKQISIGKTYQQKIVLRNNSKNLTIYKVIIPKQLQNIFTTNNINGSISGQQMQEIVFKLQYFTAITIDSQISFLIRGGKTINLPLKANIILPKVRIQNFKIDFGSTPIQGNPASKSITLINQSPIPVDLQFKIPSDSFLYNQLKLSKLLDQNCTLIYTNHQQSKQSSSKTIEVTVIRLNSKSKSSILLEFTPEQVKQYQFNLPLFIYNSLQIIDDLQRLCICKGIKNRLMASQKQINFGKIIIQQNIQAYQKNRVLQIKNPQEEPIQWWIDDTNIYPFSLQKSSGRLQAYQKINLKIFFYSDIQGQYVKQLQFFIDQGSNNSNNNSYQQNSNVQNNQQYLKVTVRASSCFPTLYFDQPYVIMPVVNINQESKAVFQIINGGYQNINIRHVVTQQFSNVDLKVNFLQGSNLGVTKKRIKVQILFKSQKPISFTLKINFYDSTNRIFSIPISGTADNCLYTMIQDQRTQNYQAQIEKNCNFMKFYINSIGCLQDQLYEFPRSIIQNDFQKFNQLLNNFSTSFQKVKSQVKKSTKYFFSFDYLAQVIKNIKSQGGFLNQIRPQFLLSYSEYLQAIKLRANSNTNVLSNYNMMSQSIFEKQQRRSWLILIYQIVKVYSRVNVGKTKNSQFWMKFSQRQKLIVNWLEQAYISQAKVQYPKKLNILQELHDGQILSAVISKYTNIKVLQVYGRQIKGIKQKQRRVKSIVDTFAQIGINCHCRGQDILRSNPKQMLLIIQSLYLILPSYLQKGEPILFSCALGQTITKSIEISNPSKNSITYMAKIQGCKAYVIENQTQFVIESNSTHQVKIKYISNININNASGTLTLTGKASAKFTPSTFIFVLKSQNLGRISEKSIQVNGQLYEQYQFGINVQNNFDSDAEFKVQLVNGNANKQIPISFICLNPIVKIKKGEGVNFNMIFLPLVLQNQKCILIFRDPKVGQFQYQINGTVQLPTIIVQTLKIPQSLFTNKKYNIVLPIPVKNQNLLKAKKIIQSYFEKIQKKPQAKTQQTIVNNYQKYYPKINSAQPYNVKIMPQNQMVILKGDTIYIKDLQQIEKNQNMTGTLNNTMLNKDLSNINNQTNIMQQPKVPLQINMKVAVKQASFYLLIRNQSGTDIRKYKVVLNSHYKPLRYQLQMKSSVNKFISQKLPLINLNHQTNTFIVSLQTNQTSKGVITIDKQKQVLVQGKATQNVTVIFKPKNQVNYMALIKIQNITTGQIIEYQINGLGQEPEAQTLNFDQQIRKQKTHQIKLPIQRNCKCTVSKFTLQDSQFEKNFVLTPANNIFRFKTQFKLPGSYDGKLIIEQDMKVYAYKIVVNARDIIQDEIKIKTIQRKSYFGQIAGLPQGEYIITCTNQYLKFDRNFNSSLKLNGGIFKYQFYSTIVDQYMVYLIFKNQTIGQLTYLLKIKVQEMPQTKFEVFKTQLNSRHQQIIKFQNHQNTPLKINGQCSHPTNFFYEPINIVVAPKSSLEAKIIYIPSKLQLEQGKINFMSEKGQKWNYHLSGYGLLQSKPKLVQMKGIVGKQNIQSISFINPFQKKVQVHISLKNLDQNEENIFELILKGNKCQLDYRQELNLPILIKPKKVSINRCLLTLTISQKIAFKYQINVINQYTYPQERNFKIQARMKKEQIITFNLPFLNTNDLNTDTKAKLKITAVNESMKPLIKQAIKILNKEKNIQNDGKVSYQLNLKAFKPFKALTHFMIILPNGCKWIQKINITFTEPVVDDKIQIIAQMNKPSSMRFKLTNRIKHHAKFKAYFTTNSAQQFSVVPKVGQLQPFGRQGTPFQIIFSPNIYKKQWQGKLIIQTDQSYWSYDIKGMLPPYLPPIASKSSLQIKK